MLFTSLSCLFLLQIVSNVHGSSLPSHLPQYYFQDSQTTHLLLSSSLNTAALNVVSLDEQHQTAINYFKQSIGVTSDTGYRVDRSWRDNEGIFHAYISPMLEGIEVENAQAAIHVDKFGRVSSMSHSWISPSASSSSSSLSPRLSVQSVVVGGGDGGEDDVNDDDVDLTASSPITPQQAYTLASTAINKNNPVVSGDYPSLKDSVAVKYYRRRDGGLERAYEFMIPSSTHLYQVFVSISTGEVIHDK